MFPLLSRTAGTTSTHCTTTTGNGYPVREHGHLDPQDITREREQHPAAHALLITGFIHASNPECSLSCNLSRH